MTWTTSIPNQEHYIISKSYITLNKSTTHKIGACSQHRIYKALWGTNNLFAGRSSKQFRQEWYAVQNSSSYIILNSHNTVIHRKYIGKFGRGKNVPWTYHGGKRSELFYFSIQKWNFFNSPNVVNVNSINQLHCHLHYSSFFCKETLYTNWFITVIKWRINILVI